MRRSRLISRRFGAQVPESRGPFNFPLMNNLAAAGVLNRYVVSFNDDVRVRSASAAESLSPLSPSRLKRCLGWGVVHYLVLFRLLMTCIESWAYHGTIFLHAQVRS